MRKILLFILLMVSGLALRAQTDMYRGMRVGYPAANMATIDSIKYVGGELVFYRGAVATKTYGGIYDHGAMTGLLDDDHPNYYNASRLNAWIGSMSLTTVGNLTSGTWAANPIADAYIPNTITLNNVTQITSRSHNDLQDVGTKTHIELEADIATNTASIAGLSVATDSTFETITAYDTIFFGASALNKLYQVGTLAHFKVNDQTSVIFGEGSATGGNLFLGDSINFNLGTTEQIGVDGANSLFFKDGNAGSYTLSQLIAAAVPGLDSVSYSYTSCTANATTNIIIGDTADITFKMSYVAWRDIGTRQMNFGNIMLSYDEVNDTVMYTSNHIGPDLGITITGDKSATALRLNIAVDNTNANAATFGYINIQTGTTVLYVDQDTISLEDVARVKLDTVTMYSAPVGRAIAADSAIWDTDAIMGRVLVSVPDTTYFTELNCIADSAEYGSTPNFTLQLYYTSTIASAGTALLSSALTVAGSEPVTTGETTTTFNNQYIPPGDYFFYWKMPAITTKPTAITVSLKGYYINGH